MQESLLNYFEETCSKYSKKKAIVTDKGSVDFCFLRELSLRIARNIKAHTNYKVNSPIFVYLPKTYQSIAAFLGVLYAGDFYTPSDVTFPFKKIQGILNVLKPQIYISNTKYSKKLIENGISVNQIINVDELKEYEGNIDIQESISYMTGKKPVYVFFTSGSTGIPKGVEISNDSVINFIKWIVKDFKLDDSTVLGNQAEFYFDLSCFDVFAMIGAGATMHIIPKSLFTFPKRLMQYICDNGINTISWVPSALISVANADALEELENIPLKKILFCGEVLPIKHLNYWRSKIKLAMFVNMYGPTEATCACTYYCIDRDFKEDEMLPIGEPCINTKLYILDENNHKIRDGEIGELCIEGEQLANGYYNDENKTQQFFVNYIDENESKRIYRTGDLVTYNENGEIIYIGRKDFQIKYKGYRIELGEIESAAYTCDGIKRVCALFNQSIILYYEGEIIETELGKYLRKYLPKYMIPQRIVKLSVMPLNQNGKIDRKKLKEIVFND